MTQLTNKPLLYFDMEWVPAAYDFEQLRKTNPTLAEAWERRCDKWKLQGKHEGKTASEIWSEESGFFPEFIQIICITCGYYKEGKFALQSFYGDNEKDILSKVHELFNKVAGKYQLCGHSIKRFDMPYLAKRLAIHGFTIPWLLNNGAKKPWEIECVDLAEEWGFGCNQEKYTPLDWICVSLGIETPKQDIAGHMVSHAYWQELRLEDIKDYCERDVIATAEAERALRKLTHPQEFELV